MDRRSLVLVSATLAAALAILVVVGLRVLERDRDALFARYGSERQRAAQEAARGLTGDIAEVGEDLALASALLRETISTQLAERQLHAIASIKREDQEQALIWRLKVREQFTSIFSRGLVTRRTKASERNRKPSSSFSE